MLKELSGGSLKLIFILFTFFIFSHNVNADLMGLSLDVEESGINIGTGNITVEIWTSSSGGVLVYNSTNDFIDNITQGKVDITLGGSTQAIPLNLTYGDTYFMEVYVNNNDINFSGFDRQEFTSTIGNVSSERVNFSTSIIPDANDTFDLGSSSAYFSNLFVSTLNILTKIATAQIADSAITGALIAARTITSDDIADSAVNTTLILDATILPEDISSVGWTNLTDYPGACPAGEAVTQIGDTITCASVSSLRAEDLLFNNETNIINTTHIVDRTITADDLADSSVNTSIILDATINSDDLSLSNLTISIFPNDVGYWSDSSVLLLNNETSIINTTHILDNTITTEDILLNTINGSDIDLNSEFIITNLSVTDNLTAVSNLTAAADLIILGTIFGGSPLEIGDNLTVTQDLTVYDNITTRSTIISDYLKPNLNFVVEIVNLSIIQDLRVLGNSYLGSFSIESDLIIGNNNLSSTFLGLGTLSPSSILHINLSESANSTLSNILTFERSNSSDPLQDNTGFSLLFQHIDDAGEVENISMISSIFTDVSNGSERSALSFYTGYGDGNGIISNLSSSEALRINSNLSTTIFGDLAVLGNSYLGTLTFTDNGTFPDSILVDFIYPESSGVVSFQSLANFIGNVSFLDNFTVDGSTFYVDASSNRIGIGTTSPQAMLEISNSSALSVPWLNITSGGTDAKFIIDTAGNVGIGTTAPVEKLMITIADSGTTWANYDGIRIYNTDTTTNAGGRLVFNLGDSGTAQAGIAGVIVASSDSALAFITEDSDTITEKMRITETGNVGIGTTDPADLLVVQNSNKANISLAPSGNNAIIRMDYITGNDAIIMFRENSIEKGRIAYVGDTKELRLISSEAESILTLHSNNTERIRINAAGNVGIGTTSPGALLEIVDGDVNITNGTGDWGMIFDEATGFVGMGYSINDNWAQLNGPLSIFASGDNGSSAIRIQTNDATGEHSGIGFYTASLPGQSFPLGLVGLEKTSDTGQHSGDLVFYTRPGTTNVAPIERMRITSGGDICDPATDADLSDCASDARLKTNIQDYQYGLNEILQLRPVNFNWNQKAVSELSYNPNLTNTGLIAQEVEQIIPEWVETKEDGYKKIPGSGDLDLVLVNAVKELNSKISALEQQNNELKAEISALKEPSLEKNPREKKK